MCEDCSLRAPRAARSWGCSKRTLRLTQGQRKEGRPDWSERCRASMGQKSRLRLRRPPVRRCRGYWAAATQGLPQGRTEPGCAEAGRPKPRREGVGVPPLVRRSPQQSSEREGGSATTSHIRARDKLPRRKSIRRRKRRWRWAWRGGARSRWRGVSRTSIGGISVAQR